MLSCQRASAAVSRSVVLLRPRRLVTSARSIRPHTGSCAGKTRCALFATTAAAAAAPLVADMAPVPPQTNGVKPSSRRAAKHYPVVRRPSRQAAELM